MISISSRGRKALAALIAVSALGGAMAPVEASAKGWHTGGALAAGAFGGLLLGSALADSRPVYEERVIYDRRCWTERRKFYDYDGYPHYRRIRVCD